MPEFTLKLPEPFLQRDLVAYQLGLQERGRDAKVNAQVDIATVKTVLDLGWLSGLAAPDVETTDAYIITSIARQVRDFIGVQVTTPKKA